MTLDPRLVVAERCAARLALVPGVVAVALGGSLARGVQRPDSDVDLGVYYEPEDPPLREDLRLATVELDDRGEPDGFAYLSEWGPWINGGAWMQVDGVKVDLLWRGLGRMRWAIDECSDGRTSCHYQPGHPHGFWTHIYLGEVHTCRPMHDPEGKLAELKPLVEPYPTALKASIIRQTLWEVEFTLDLARKPAARGDAVYVSGCLFRVASCLIQALYAINERYCVNEKGAIEEVATLTRVPDGFAQNIRAILASPGMDADELSGGLEKIERHRQAIREMCSSERGTV